MAQKIQRKPQIDQTMKKIFKSNFQPKYGYFGYTMCTVVAIQGDFRPKKIFLAKKKNFFFFGSAGFPPGFGVSEIGVYHENDPQKIFFLPEKAVVARFARASLTDTGKAKRAGGCYKNFFLGRVETGLFLKTCPCP